MAFRIERAFTQIYRRIIRGSTRVARLRAAIWESIFTRDMRRFIRSLLRGTSGAASKQLDVDWRVVRKRIDFHFLQLLWKATGSASPSQSRP
jgi:hypothetical protein